VLWCLPPESARAGSRLGQTRVGPRDLDVVSGRINKTCTGGAYRHRLRSRLVGAALSPPFHLRGLEQLSAIAALPHGSAGWLSFLPSPSSCYAAGSSTRKALRPEVGASRC
jgi:hypothetical protein